jgi:hypothetical protein
MDESETEFPLAFSIHYFFSFSPISDDFSPESIAFSKGMALLFPNTKPRPFLYDYYVNSYFFCQ